MVFGPSGWDAHLDQRPFEHERIARVSEPQGRFGPPGLKPANIVGRLHRNFLVGNRYAAGGVVPGRPMANFRQSKQPSDRDRQRHEVLSGSFTLAIAQRFDDRFKVRQSVHEMLLVMLPPADCPGVKGLVYRLVGW